MIGAAAILIIVGGSLFHSTAPEANTSPARVR
jgi:hypothetical protein